MTDPLAATLAEIRADLAYLRSCAGAIATTPEAFDLGVLMPRYGRAVAAVEAVLELHRPARDDPAWCDGCGLSWTCPTVRAITRELTGKEGSDEQ